MIDLLELQPEMTIAELGSGCGLTAITFAKFGAYVKGYEIIEKSCDISRKYAKQLEVSDKIKI